MNAKQQHALLLRKTDISGAIRRLGNNETLYITCLISFLDDPTINELNEAINNNLWDEAFTAAHALKGLAGNMGFVPLMHSTGQLVVVIRGGRVNDVGDCMMQINSSYRDICDAIRENFIKKDTGEYYE